SKVNDDRIKVWTLQNPEQNGTSDNSNNHNGTTSATTNKPPLYVRRKKKQVNGAEKEEDNKTKQQINSQASEVKLTFCQKYLSWRFLMVFLLQSSFVVAIFIRNCLPMAIVCMVKPKAPLSTALGSNTTNFAEHLTESRFQNTQSLFDNVSFYNESTHQEESTYEFDWDPEVQGLVLTSIMFTSFIGPLLANAMKEKLGNKLTLTILTLVSTLLTFLSPVAARINPYLLVALRILIGISVGGNVSVIGDCIAWWAPQDEKLTMVALTFTGVNIGSILASVLSGYLCLVPLDNGWPFVFYTFGFISLIWCLCWYLLISEKPEEHPYISEKEKQYIIAHRSGLSQPSEGVKVKLPYRQLLTSGPVLAYFATTTCHVWSTLLVFTYLPLYFNKVMKFTVQETGLLVSLTSTFRMIGTFIWTVIGNKLVSVVSVNKSRKICICSGFMLGGVTAVIVGFFDHNYKWLVLGLLIVLMLAQSVGSCTISALPLDIAPRYAGVLTGMCLSFASLIGISGPLLAAAITPEGTQEEWQTVWIVMGCVFITGFVIFLLFGQATLQPWATGTEAQHPNIMSPFVTMARRFSTFLEAPPLSPVTPRDKGFNFSINYSSQSAIVLTQLATATPDIYYTGNFDLTKSIVPENNLVPTPENQESEDNESSENDDSKYENENVKQIKEVRRRAYSESVLDVYKSNIAQETIKEEQGLAFGFDWQNKVDRSAAGETTTETQNVQTQGIDNNAYENQENVNEVNSDGTQIARL
ncbi:unnamed protein product, partial [Candidula unifasciata]